LPHTVARLARGDLVGLDAVLLGEEGAQVSQNIAQARVGSTDDVKMLKRIQGVGRRRSITLPRLHRPPILEGLLGINT
jgi:hypothetical protein